MIINVPEVNDVAIPQEDVRKLIAFEEKVQQGEHHS